MVERQYAAQPQPIAAAEMAGAEDDKRGRKGSAYEYKRVPNLIAEATRAREPRRVWAGSSPYGASAFTNLRSGLPSGYGVGEAKVFARPNIPVLCQNRPRSSVRQQGLQRQESDIPSSRKLQTMRLRGNPYCCCSCTGRHCGTQ